MRDAPHWTEIDWRPHLHDAVVDGRRLRCVDYGDGPPIVLVHGLGGCWQTWLANVPALGARRRVLAVDLPGFGASEPLGAGASFEAYVRALEGLLDERGIDRAVIAGHSMGGLLAGRFAATHPDRVHGLALVAAGGIALSPRRLQAIVRAFLVFNAAFARPAAMRAVARRPRLRRAVLSGFLGDGSSLPPELAAEVLPLMAAPGFADAVLAAAAAATDPGFEAIEAETLLLWGSRDRILPVEGARRLARRMPRARLEVLQGVGHCPMFERPGAFNHRLEAFADASVSERSLSW